MQTVSTRVEVGGIVRRWREAGESLAFVPTMGNLHEGHMRLLRESQGRADRVVISIFVNPMQFNDPDDFRRYPRTLKEDAGRLVDSGVDVLFMPEATEIYPHGIEAGARVLVPGLSDILCGAFRPGHFTGVATVVAALFNIVRPDIALFGEKDYQQLLVIRRMVEDLSFPITVRGVPTVREPDGLAMSSRNRYLDADERKRAPALYRCLCEMRDELLAGRRDYSAVESEAMHRLESSGFRPDYTSIRRAGDLEAPQENDPGLVILAAAWLGGARLIDNVPCVLTGKDKPPR